MPPDSPRPEPSDVVLARLDGRLETLQQTVDLRISQAEERARKAQDAAKAAHQRLDSEVPQQIRPIHEEVHELRVWKGKVVGVAVGIGTVAGAAGGIVVWALEWAANGGPG